MTFRFTAGWSQLLVALGMTVIVLSIVAAAIVAFVPLPWTATAPGTVERSMVAVGILGGGVILGASLIVTGQLLLAFLNVRENLERLTHRFAGEDYVFCPYCAEDIKPEATLCPHCRSDLRRPTASDRLLGPRS